MGQLTSETLDPVSTSSQIAGLYRRDSHHHLSAGTRVRQSGLVWRANPKPTGQHHGTEV